MICTGRHEARGCRGTCSREADLAGPESAHRCVECGDKQSSRGMRSALGRPLHMRCCCIAACSRADMGICFRLVGSGGELVSAYWLQLLCSRGFVLFVGGCLGRASRGVREARQAQHWDHCIITASRLCAVVGLQVACRALPCFCCVVEESRVSVPIYLRVPATRLQFTC